MPAKYLGFFALEIGHTLVNDAPDASLIITGDN